MWVRIALLSSSYIMSECSYGSDGGQVPRSSESKKLQSSKKIDWVIKFHEFIFPAHPHLSRTYQGKNKMAQRIINFNCDIKISILGLA